MNDANTFHYRRENVTIMNRCVFRYKIQKRFFHFQHLFVSITLIYMFWSCYASPTTKRRLERSQLSFAKSTVRMSTLSFEQRHSDFRKVISRLGDAFRYNIISDRIGYYISLQFFIIAAVEMSMFTDAFGSLIKRGDFSFYMKNMDKIVAQRFIISRCTSWVIVSNESVAN